MAELKFDITRIVDDVVEQLESKGFTPMKRGEWINEYLEDDMMNVWWADCSACGKETHSRYGRVSTYSYCPNCGADMRGDDKDEKKNS